MEVLRKKVWMNFRLLLAFCVLVLLAGGCSGNQASMEPVGQSIEQFPNGDTILNSEPVNQDAAKSPAKQPDTDRDGITDMLEQSLGTDPLAIDTDMDGLTDHYELWGVSGFAVGNVGSTSDLPDANGNGVIAALDPGDMGGQVLKNASNLLNQERVPVTLPEEGEFLPNDMDGDGIPNDFELHGFYFMYDENLEPFFVKWNGLVSDIRYFKTDPTKWSTDGDPFSDWEESTRINLDQRIKFPGDHPCIPAYPRMHLILDKYTITLNQDVVIETTEGRAAESSWINTTNSVNTTETVNQGQWGVGGFVDLKFGMQANSPFFGIEGGIHLSGGYQGESTTVNETTIDSSTSGLSSEEWSTARAVSGNTLEAAFVNLNFHLVNTGTLPADNLVAICNLRLGTEIIASFLAGNDENGELKGRSGNVITLQVSTTGIPTYDDPTGKALVLSMNQLRSLQSGAPLTVEVESFQGDTIVWDIDPDTGRRTFLTYGDWSPYDAAIKNTSARVQMDFGDDPTYGSQLFNGLPIMRVEEVRVACFPTNGTYVGSPPRINLYDAFHWAYEVRPSSFGPVVTIRDPISNWKHTSLIANWNFGFDRETVEDILANPQDYENLALIPLEPGNPVDRYYTCTAPPQGELTKPQIYWALCEPKTRLIRSYSRDLRGIKEMRFKPDPEADYDGEEMVVGYNVDDPDMQFFYTYELPAQYKWTGFEQVVAINSDNKRTEMNIQILGSQLGQIIDSDTFGVSGGGVQGFSFDNVVGASITDPPYDFTFEQTWVGDDLTLTLTPANGGLLHDAMVVIDPPGEFLLDYNYLRKQAYGTPVLVETIPAGATTEAPVSRTYCVLSQTGVLAVFSPVLFCQDTVAPFKYEVGEIVWRTYEGI